LANDKHNWPEIKSAYVEGYVDDSGAVVWPTLDQCAQDFNVSISTLRKRAAHEDWSEEKNAYRQNLEQARQERKIDVLADKATKFDEQVFKAAEAGLRHVQGHFLKYQDQLIESEGRNPMNLRYLNDLGNALEKFQRIGRLALGEATEIGMGGSNGGDSYYLIQAIIGNPDNAERIKEHFRQNASGKLSSE